MGDLRRLAAETVRDGRRGISGYSLIGAFRQDAEVSPADSPVAEHDIAQNQHRPAVVCQLHHGSKTYRVRAWEDSKTVFSKTASSQSLKGIWT